MKHKQNIITSQERAAALIEFMLVLPIMIIVIFLGIEFSRALYHMQLAASLSHQAANLAYRDCVGDPAGNPRTADQISEITGTENRKQIERCLEARRQIVQGVANRMAPGSVITVSLYRYDEGSKSAARFPSAPARSAFSWKDPEEGIVASSKSESSLFSRSHLLAGEAFIRFETALSGIWEIVGGAPMEFYDALVL